ncbi:MAG: hypothetical protein QXW98_03745 [Candidatus Caldarchaeum sp.]
MDVVKAIHTAADTLTLLWHTWYVSLFAKLSFSLWRRHTLADSLAMVASASLL